MTLYKTNEKAKAKEAITETAEHGAREIGGKLETRPAPRIAAIQRRRVRKIGSLSRRAGSFRNSAKKGTLPIVYRCLTDLPFLER